MILIPYSYTYIIYQLIILKMLSKIALGAASIMSVSAAGTAEWKGRTVY
jgi:hypothetical protein